MEQLSKLFLYIPGILIFLVGSGQMRGWLRSLKPDAVSEADVLSCQHVVKKDKHGNDVFNYYNVTVEYKDHKTGHIVRQSLKSPTEYAPGQQVRLFWGAPGEKPQLSEKENEALFHPLVMTIGGALLILLALFQNQGREVPAMACLSAIMIGAGISLLFRFIKLKKMHLQPLTAVIDSVYTRQISKETRILRGSRYTYYPVVRYELDGRENIRRCNINSSGEGSFKPGEPMTLYLEPDTGAIYEKHAHPGYAVAGVLTLGCGIAAGLSILSVIL